ncbi:MAG: ribose transport system ATP-binding protein [Clostridiales bacterium]|nr:ribose transport system ATP-binding protein [Clostridiales bacterium]MDK2933749.1 ribose transport system ATP-binding protein [Clostridiales bacterium]
MNRPILKMENISKSFPGVKALDHVNLELYTGKVLALLGENGAGKSTLMKILSGVYTKDSGDIYFEGNKIDIHSPKHAQSLGIAIIHQELNLLPYLSIAENIFIGREFTKNMTGRIDWKKLYRESKKYLEQLGVTIDPRTLVKNLSVGEQQMVEIAKALSLDAKIIIMDEPTDALTNKETEKLFKVIRTLKQNGKAIVYISHRLKEIFEICDDVTVMRDGKYIGSANVKNIDQEKLIEMMVGRKLEDKFPRKILKPGKEMIRVEHLSKKGVLKDVNLSVRSGEVVGLSGLMGAGRTELAKAIFGALKIDSGDIYLEGEKVKINNPKDAVSLGIAYVSEDRKMEGLILKLSVRHNMTLSALGQFSTAGQINANKESRQVEEYIKKLAIKTPSSLQRVKNLSGGNQQKVVLSKWMMINPKVLILDEPTRGVDVGAKVEIYELINKLKESGVAIIMISSEMPEVMGISDRIVVMHEGKITGEFTHDEVSQEKIMQSAVGMK